MKILVTRPSPEGEQLTEQLRNFGIEAYHTPLIRFAPGQDLLQFPSLLKQLMPQDLVCVLSPRVIPFVQPLLQAQQISWPDQVHYIAIGKSSAHALQNVCRQHVNTPLGREISESLLHLPQLQLHAVKGKNILILRGNPGRELLVKTLQSRHAIVTCCECYQRVPITYEPYSQTAYWIKQGIDTIVVTSGEMLQQLYTLVPSKQHDWLLSCRLLVVSERLALLAQQLGWLNTILVAEHANNDALIRTLQ